MWVFSYYYLILYAENYTRLLDSAVTVTKKMTQSDDIWDLAESLR